MFRRRPVILIALGANLPFGTDKPAVTLTKALKELGRRGAVPVGVSSFTETAAWPDPSQPPFVNAVARIETAIQPIALMELLHEVETDFGRKRSAPNAPRTLDLDLLDYDGLILDGPLVLPHPRMTDRAFVLAPLAQVAPGWRHPVSGRDAAALLAAL